MRIEFRVGDIEFHGVSLDRFDDFSAFSEKWADRVVPGKALLSSWDHVSQTWSRPGGRKSLKIVPGLQCFSVDAFGARDQATETATLQRLLAGLGVTLTDLKAAIEKSVPTTAFHFDVADAVPEVARKSASWQVFGEPRFDHFVLRFPVGRVSDWALLSVATDFTLSRRRIGQAFPLSDAPVGQQDTTLADRVLDIMASGDRTSTNIRPH